jgi:hypothetical protein
VTRRHEIDLPPAPPARLEPLVVRAVTGMEELRALQTPGLQRALTTLIAACAHVEGADHPLGVDAARALSSGERTRIGLAIAAASDGGVLRRSLRCPEPRCRAAVPFEANLEDLPERPPSPESGTVRCPVPSDRALPVRGYATFRLPDGADQEAVEASSSDSREVGIGGGPVLVRLLDRLLVAVHGNDLPGETAVWSEEDRQSAWNAVRGALGGPDTELEAVCPLCGTRFVQRLSPLGWLRADPKESEARLRAEVTRLQARLGWTEEQALWLPRPERRRLAGA